MQYPVHYMSFLAEEVMSFETFKQSHPAQSVAPLLADVAVIARMEELSRAGKPAVAALDAELAGKLTLTNTERQYVGRWVRDVLVPRGWKPLRQRRISGGRVFSSGAVYGRLYAPLVSGDDQALSLDAKIARAQELVRRFSTNDYSVDDFIRDKRLEVAREEERWGRW